MSCQSAIYTTNENVSVGANATIPFGSIVRRYGKSCQLSGSGINLLGSGYYNVSCSVSFTPTATGPVTIQLMQGDTMVGSATSQGTASEPVNITAIALVRNCGCTANSVLTATSSAAGEADISTIVEKK